MLFEQSVAARSAGFVVSVLVAVTVIAGCSKKSEGTAGGPPAAKAPGAGVGGAAAGPAKAGGVASTNGQAPAKTKTGSGAGTAAGDGTAAAAAGGAAGGAAPAGSVACRTYVAKVAECAALSLADVPGSESFVVRIRDNAAESCQAWETGGADKLAAAVEACASAECGEVGATYSECVSGKVFGSGESGSGAMAGAGGAAIPAGGEPAPGTDPVGKWSLSGKTRQGGAYRGEVEIVRQGDVYGLAFNTPGTTEGRHPGIGLFQPLADGGHLFVASSDDERIGVALYRIGSDGSLSGRWTIAGIAPGVGTETWTGGGGSDPGGHYQVTGAGPDGSTYTTTVDVSTDGRSYSVRWNNDAGVQDGVGLRWGEWLGVAFGTVDPVGVTHYSFHDGVASASFATTAGPGLGIEDLTPATGGAVAAAPARRSQYDACRRCSADPDNRSLCSGCTNQSCLECMFAPNEAGCVDVCGGGPSGGGRASGGGGGSQAGHCSLCAQDAIEAREDCDRCTNRACLSCYVDGVESGAYFDGTLDCSSVCGGGGSGGSGRSSTGPDSQACRECWGAEGPANEDDCYEPCH
ncbi:MAG: hypothetical protein HY907_06405 [Deltaproteobacteria bacterium]|nr:hypothetical protein [Deltaproteobacteria bacterium]